MTKPDSTAVRVALWRALHLNHDAPPHILKDELALKLAAPEAGWENRPDMHPQRTATFRASIVTRSRVVEDLVQNSQVPQYVLLGAGLDTFAFRTHLPTSIFEIDRPETLAWKAERMKDLGLAIPKSLTFVPIDFERNERWWEKLQEAGFEPQKSSVIASLGLSMYLSREVVLETLKLMRKLAPGSTFVMTFLWPLNEVAPEDRMGYERSIEGAQRSGTPFVSFFTADEMTAVALEVGFTSIEVTSTHDLAKKYCEGRSDGLLASTGEGVLIAKT